MKTSHHFNVIGYIPIESVKLNYYLVHLLVMNSNYEQFSFLFQRWRIRVILNGDGNNKPFKQLIFCVSIFIPYISVCAMSQLPYLASIRKGNT